LRELDDNDLLSSGNLIDIVLYAAKYAARCGHDRQKNKYLRIAIGLLAERGWNMDDKRKLMLFIERIISLTDEGLKIQHREYLEQLDREGKIVYVSIAEEYYTQQGIETGRLEGIKMGRLEGIETGIEKGRLEVARNLLIDGVSPDIIARGTQLPIEKIRELMN
jgi:predicted transposase/invertase (TIGR01784 family)